MPRTEATKAEIGIYTIGRQPNPPAAQYVIDVGGLRDPQSSGGFRNTTPDGRDAKVVAYVREDERVAAITDQVEFLSWLALNGNRNSGWISFLIRDHHGKWIAPAVGEILADYLSNLGYRVCCYHYGLNGGELR